MRNFDNQSLQSEMRALWNLLERKLLKESTPTTTGTKDGCLLCGNKTHFKRECPKRSRSPNPSRRSQGSRDYGRDPLIRLAKDKGCSFNSGGWQHVFAIIDTGANATVLSRAFAEEVGLSGTTGRKTYLQNAESGKEMEANTNVKTTIRLGKMEIELKVCIAPIRDDVLIGMDLLKEVDGIILE